MRRTSICSDGAGKSALGSCDGEESYDHYQLGDLTTQEVDRCNRMVSPSQRLMRKSSLFSEDGDVTYTSDNTASSSHSVSTETALDRVKHYVAHHSFYQHRAVIFTSQRRAFEREIYDFARSLHLSPKEAQAQVVRARVSYGEDMASDAEDTAWEGEVDDRAPVRSTADSTILAPSREMQSIHEEALSILCKESTLFSTEAVVPKRKPEAFDDFELGRATHEHPPFRSRRRDYISPPDSGAKPVCTSELQPVGLRLSRGNNRCTSASLKGEALAHDSEPAEHGRARKRGEKLVVGAKRDQCKSKKKTEYTEAGSDSDHTRITLEPKIQEEALKKRLRSNTKDAGGVLHKVQAEEEQQRLREHAADSNAYIEDTRDFAMKEQVDQDKGGGIKGASINTKEESRAEKDEHDTRENLPQRVEGMEAQEITKNGSEGFSPSDEAASVTAVAEDVSKALDVDQTCPSFQHQVSLPKHDNDFNPTSPPLTRNRRKRKRATSSSYFPPSTQEGKLPTRKNISCIPFPPLTSQHFGLMQERLANDPFRLLIAVIFLNKTRGSVAMPVFYALMERYPSVEALAEAKHDDVLQHIEHLGLQNQRAKKLISVARAWLACPPEKGKRYRCLHYPRKGDGSDVKPGEVVDDENKDTRVAWEVAHLPGLGAYAFDSWRIFCRDRLRGLDASWDEEIIIGDAGTDHMGGRLQPEWTRVVPTDKELRAYLRWRWLKVGWVWDPLTGCRERATEQQLKDADGGGVTIDQQEAAIDKREV